MSWGEVLLRGLVCAMEPGGGLSVEKGFVCGVVQVCNFMGVYALLVGKGFCWDEISLFVRVFGFVRVCGELGRGLGRAASKQIER